MTWRAIPPTGNPIALVEEDGALPAYDGYRAVWVNSGTAALALAFFLARHRQSQIAAPEVVLPGYACPDLVAAAVHAGVRPVIADIGDDDPGYNFDSLRRALSSNTVGVVAVNFLGIRERLADLRELLSHHPAAALIEDDAQWFPEPLAAATLSGDAVCLSFGRGKPVSLLGGGVLFIRDSFAACDVIAPLVAPAEDAGAGLHWKIRAYNCLLSPMCYGLLSRVPLLTLGSTVFKPLPSIRALDRRRLRLLPRNVAVYLNRETNASRIQALPLPSVMDLPAKLRARSGRLLRYPILCSDSRQRDMLWKKMRSGGLGASAMYQRPLSAIEGARKYITMADECHGARRFADRLLTLPVHTGVSAERAERIGEILRSEL